MSRSTQSARTAPTGTRRPRLHAAVAAALLAGASLPALAIDPLPPELEHASLAQQSAWRDRMGRESKADRDRLARVRHEERMNFKTNLATSLREETSSVLANARTPVAQPSTAEETWAENSGQFRWIAIVAGLIAAGFVTRRVLSPAAE